MIVHKTMSLEDKLKILSAAARYDVSCTSSGVDRKGEKGTLGNATACGICHSFAADGRCISLLKVLLSNECVFDCKYCMNRASNDIPRASFTPEELCSLTIQFYRRNYIEGLFLSSGVLGTPDHTMELFYQTLYMLRYQYQFNGYVHVKTIPGADGGLIRRLGYLADRMSVNLEISSQEGLKKLAPHKTHASILTPIRQIQNGILHDRLEGRRADAISGPISTIEQPVLSRRTEEEQAFLSQKASDIESKSDITLSGNATSHKNFSRQHIPAQSPLSANAPDRDALDQYDPYWQYLVRSAQTVRRDHPHFVPSGQSTQMIIGAVPESDYQLVHTAQALYQDYSLKRVFYSAYVPINEDSSLPSLDTKPPLLREHRLYQADWLLRFYGFQAGELLSADRPNFNLFIDPKCDWAVRHLELFPVEINTASYADLLRVPGIGVKSAKRIVYARKHNILDFNTLKKMGVVLKRAHYFITLNGRMMYPIKIDETFITHNLIQSEQKKNWQVAQDMTYQQLSLFDDFHLIDPGEIIHENAAL